MDAVEYVFIFYIYIFVLFLTNLQKTQTYLMETNGNLKGVSLFMSYINRKRDIKHGEECPAFITYCSIVLYGLISAI